MILVTGGAYQGKLAYARKTYEITDGWIDGRDCELSQITSCRGIHHFHEYVKRMTGTKSPETGSEAEPEHLMTAGEKQLKVLGENGSLAVGDTDAGTNALGQWCFQIDDLTALETQADRFASWLVKENPKLVIVSNELGYGIVPMEKQDRLWREATGRICTCLAAEADEVVRVVCGIGNRLK